MARQRGRATDRSAGRGGTVLLALTAGLAGGLIAPLLLPSAARAARPAAKSTVKTALALYERGRETVAEFAEIASDIIAEAQAEFADERQQRLARAAGDVVALHAAGAEQRNA
ncbi:MAG TPA: DUF5132 domain-containing protein [Stellaceae bacterium]|nr:DUF5132 domain-containing protein [Stellaceae bacterium]